MHRPCRALLSTLHKTSRDSLKSEYSKSYRGLRPPRLRVKARLAFKEVAAAMIRERNAVYERQHEGLRTVAIAAIV